MTNLYVAGAIIGTYRYSADMAYTGKMNVNERQLVTGYSIWSTRPSKLILKVIVVSVTCFSIRLCTAVAALSKVDDFVTF